jgi:hypothetical protein
MDWVPSNVVDALASSHQLGIFTHIATSPPLRVWFGVEDIPITIESVDEGGAIYQGGGRLIGLPTLEVLVNGTADAVEFTMSGIDPATGAALISSIPPVRGADVYVGITTLDDYYQPMSQIIPLWRGTASHTTEASPTVVGQQNRTTTLGLSIASGGETRSRPSRSLWSAAQQKALSPTDRFCDNTSRMARMVQPVWPNY